LKKEGEEKNRGMKSSSSLASPVQGKKKTHSAVQNDTILGFSFFFNSGTTLFWTKHVVSFKRK
jgi:hypothetical protein